jgi:hypothetical protein
MDRQRFHIEARWQKLNTHHFQRVFRKRTRISKRKQRRNIKKEQNPSTSQTVFPRQRLWDNGQTHWSIKRPSKTWSNW